MTRHIHMLWVTCRPDMFVKTHADWINKAEQPENISTKVAVSTDKDKIALKDFDVLLIKSPHSGVAHPAFVMTTTFNIPNLDDIIILASDDFYPPEKWDSFVRENVDRRCCLVVNDGVVKPHSEAVTLPILDGYAFMALNKILYHHAYRHMFSDAELYRNCNELGLLKNIRKNSEVVFVHHHYAAKLRKWDEADKRNQKFYYADRRTFRMRMDKPISYRLRVKK